MNYMNVLPDQCPYWENIYIQAAARKGLKLGLGREVLLIMRKSNNINNFNVTKYGNREANNHGVYTSHCLDCGEKLDNVQKFT